VHPWLALGQQVPEVASEQVPVDVVDLAAVLAVDRQALDAQGLKERTEDLEVGQVGEHVFAFARA
jgi:hypothetical protein